MRKKTLTMFTESLFLHVLVTNAVFAVTSGVGFLNIQITTKSIEILPFKNFIKPSMLELKT